MTNPQRYSMPLSPSSHFPEAQNHQFSQSSADRMSPSSALLQDLLREKKASQHARRTSHQSDYATYERQVQSSPIAPPAVNQPRKASDRRTSGYAAPKEMGLREMEEVRRPCSNCRNVMLTYRIVHFQDQQAKLRLKARDLPSAST